MCVCVQRRVCAIGVITSSLKLERESVCVCKDMFVLILIDFYLWKKLHKKLFIPIFGWLTVLVLCKWNPAKWQATFHCFIIAPYNTVVMKGGNECLYHEGRAVHPSIHFSQSQIKSLLGWGIEYNWGQLVNMLKIKLDLLHVDQEDTHILHSVNLQHEQETSSNKSAGLRSAVKNMGL